MFALDPRPDLFRVAFPEDFYEPSIMKKYDEILRQKNYVFDEFRTVINESIQSFDIPVFGYQHSTQEQHRLPFSTSESVSVPQQSIQRAIDNTFTITFRHSEAYLLYWCMIEHWFKKYKLGPDGNRKPMDVLILELMDYRHNSLVHIFFEKVLFTGVDGLALAYNQVDRQASTFTMQFSYSTLQPKFDIPQLNDK